MRGLVHVRAILGNIGVIVLPNQVAVPKAHEVLGEDGSVQDESVEKRIKTLALELVQITGKLGS